MNASKPTSHIIPGIPKLPARSAALVMPLILSVIMSCIVSAISTFKSLGAGPHYLGAWLGALIGSARLGTPLWAIAILLAVAGIYYAVLVRRSITALKGGLSPVAASEG